MNLAIETEVPMIGLSDEQLIESQNYITATGASKLMNGEWYELWKDKMGLSERTDPNLPMLIGTHLEPLHRYWYGKVNDFQVGVAKDPKDELIVCPSDNRLACHIDGFEIHADQGILRPWEGKAVNMMSKEADLLERYYHQLQHIMLCTEYNEIQFSVLYLNVRHNAVIVEADQDWREQYAERVNQFWRYIEEELPPPDPELETEVPHEDKKIVRASIEKNPKFIEATKVWAKNFDAAKKFQKAEKEIKAEVPTDALTIFTEDVFVSVSKNGAKSIKPMTEKKLDYFNKELGDGE